MAQLDRLSNNKLDELADCRMSAADVRTLLEELERRFDNEGADLDAGFGSPGTDSWFRDRIRSLRRRLANPTRFCVP